MKRIIRVDFDNTIDAADAIRELKEKGIPPKDISLVVSRPEIVETGEKGGEVEFGGSPSPTTSGLKTGAMTGGLFGTMTGLLSSFGFLTIPGIRPLIGTDPVAVTLSATVAGAGIGGFLGALLDFGGSTVKQTEPEPITGDQVRVTVSVELHQARKVMDVLRHHHAVPC